MVTPVRNRIAVGWLLAVIAASLCGCGSSPVTRRDFVARANAICEATLRSVRNVPPPSTTGSVSPSDLARYVRAVIPIIESELRQLRSLPRPPADREAIGRYLTALEGVVSHYRALGAAAGAGDRQGMANALAALQASPAGDLAARYGLIACAGSSGTAPTS
jgi:hypothetical protein